jgi:hypothetical protein
MSAKTTETEPLDAGVLLADLAAWWASLKPSLPAGKDMSMLTSAQASEVRATELGDYADALAGYRDRAPRRIAGSEWDQQVPEGTQNPYWEIIRQLPLDPIPLPWHYRPEPMLHWLHGPRDEYKMFADRFDMCGTYSWSICTPGDIAWLKDVLAGRGVVEPGAGTGYWAWQMEQSGISVAAYEPNQPEPGNHFARREWTTVLRDDYLAAKHHPDRALFLCWPSYADPWAAQALACYSGDLLIYAGEGEGGCTADDEFFRLLEAEWDEIGYSPKHVSYWGIHCHLTAYRRLP